MGKMKKFRFTVVINTHKASAISSTAIDSIITQSIGFMDNIQLVFVGSDDTGALKAICEKYLKSYPDNIKYVEKNRTEVENTRSTILEYIDGEYVNFFDLSDAWGRKAFEYMDRFFTDNADVKIATGRLLYQEQHVAPNFLDYKYAKTKVVNIEKEYDYPETVIAKTFIKRDLLERYQFDESITESEDLIFLNKILLDEQQYGVVREAEFFSTKQSYNVSATEEYDNQSKRLKETLTKVYRQLADYSVQRYGKVLPYVQYLIVSDVQSWIGIELPEGMSAGESADCLNNLEEVLQLVDDNIVIGQRKVPIWKKAYILKYKNRSKGEDKYKHALDELKRSVRMAINCLSFTDKEIIIVGEAIEKMIDEKSEVFAEDQGGQRYILNYEKCHSFDRKGVDPQLVLEGYVHSIKLPLKSGAKYRFILRDGWGEEQEMQLSFGKFSPLARKNYSFCERKGFIVKKIGEKICVFDNTFKRRLASTIRYNSTLKKETTADIMRIRKDAKALKQRTKKPIWIVSDRSNLAGDNGEALFEYLMSNELKDKYDIYFLIEKESPDYERIKKIGKVLEFGTRKHLITHLAASKVISSSGEEWVFNPFVSDWDYVRDIADYKFVFLQHGVIVGDLSGWLHRVKKNPSLFITSGKPEYDSIINGEYGYDSSIVKLTGLPRFDKLVDEREKLISFLPTWRKYLVPAAIPGTSRRVYSKQFKDSEYFRFYNSLINDERLLDAMKRSGYRGVFYLHPSFSKQAGDFEENDIIEVWPETAPYTTVFRKSALIVTDYSSSVMDFAYLRKPIIYTQFDKEEFYEKHTSHEGYFRHEKDGFGPVCYDYEETVATILKMINNDCKEEERYAERANRFFAYFDHNNCDRIVREIEKL